MTVRELVEALGLNVVAGAASLEQNVTGGYVCDLLSDVIANAHEGNVWVTLHGHPNVVAVAMSGALAAVLVTGGRELEPQTIQRAETEGVPLLTSTMGTWELVGKLHAMGVSGNG
jgi:predicted transcriptional regulator